MSRREILNRLLEDMDEIRPIVLDAMPDDLELRSTTRRMISDLEQIRHHPGVPEETYQWASSLLSRLIDAEHGAMLTPDVNGNVPGESKTLLKEHVEQRQMMFLMAQSEIPATHQQLDITTSLIGEKARRKESLIQRARHMDLLLRSHLESDESLKREMQILLTAFAPTLSAIHGLLEETGEEAAELKQAMDLLDQQLPDDVNKARDLLHRASRQIHSAGTKLAGATEKLHDTLQNHSDQLSAMSNELKRAENEARNDPLTGLANRRRLAEYLRSMGQRTFAFLVVDIDLFKKTNDTYGHDAGDEVLERLAIILGECTRETDLAARLGGEEFCIIFPDTDLELARKLAETLRQSIEMRPFRTKQGAIEVTASIGVAAHEPGQEHAVTFKEADKALYKAKQNGRNQVVVAPRAPTKAEAPEK